MESTLPVSAAPTPVTPPLQQAAISQLAYFGMSQRQTGDVEIRTADGDTVDISFANSTEANRLTYRHLAYTGDGTEAERLQLADAQAENELKISVAGALDDREIADIQALLKDLAQTLKQFLLGNTRAAEVHAPEAAGTIGSYTADFSIERRTTAVEALQAQTADPAGTVPGEVDPQPVEAPAPSSAAAPSAETTQPPVPVAEDPVQPMAERVQEYRPTRRMLKQLKKLLKALIKGMRSSGEIDDRQAATGRDVLDSLFNRLAPQGGQGAAAEISVTQVSVRQEWASLRYASSASTEPAAPQVEETA